MLARSEPFGHCCLSKLKEMYLGVYYEEIKFTQSYSNFTDYKLTNRNVSKDSYSYRTATKFTLK